jgi:tRNA(Arg) A34 adenosine deaminase TadA
MKHLIKATLYDKHGDILTQAENNYNKTHPVQAHFANKTGEYKRIYLHAEISALIKLRKGQIPYKIVIQRIKKDGTTGLAKPCPVCMAAIKHWNISNIEYTL